MPTTPARYSGFIGRDADGDRVFVTIELRHQDRPAQTITHDEVDSYVELSITAETYTAGRALTGDISHGGQYREAADDVIGGQIADGLDEADLDELTELWERWHLNGMRAGCAHQGNDHDTRQLAAAAVRARLGDGDSRGVPVCWAEDIIGDMPVTAEDYRHRPAYRYGSAWLVEVIPADVLAEIHALGAKLADVDEAQAEDEIETLTDDEAERRYAEWLNEALPEIEIGHATFGAGDVLREMDPIMFREGMSEWIEQEGLEVA